MKRFILILLPLLLVTGCMGSINKDFATGSEAAYEEFQPDLMDYWVTYKKLPAAALKAKLMVLTEWDGLIKVALASDEEDE